jgi:hypothetical protein
VSRGHVDTPRSLEAPVAQCGLELEVAKCVGGVISPLLLNIALHGMETAAGVRYYPDGDTMPGAPVLTRYADDLAALCLTSEQAEQVKRRLAEWLAPRGLSFNEAKTRIVHIEATGFDFLAYVERAVMPTRRVHPLCALV